MKRIKDFCNKYSLEILLIITTVVIVAVLMLLLNTFTPEPDGNLIKTAEPFDWSSIRFNW
jgi:hypothetical protein